MTAANYRAKTFARADVDTARGGAARGLRRAAAKTAKLADRRAAVRDARAETDDRNDRTE